MKNYGFVSMQCILRSLLTIILVTSNADAQKLYKISLEDLKLDPQNIRFTVSEVLDARRDKNSVGIVQLGFNNKPVFATFETPGLTEVEQLIKNSGMYDRERGLSIRVTTLKISELTGLSRETAKAQLSIDFFIRYEGLYYYISTIFAAPEPNGMDVTDQQASNIVDAIQHAFVLFSKQNKEAQPDHSFTMEELLEPSLAFRDPTSMPIMNDSKFKDGYYASFEEFVNNSPSIDIGCNVIFDSPISVVCGDEEKEASTLYGFAKDNKLYILLHQEFFELEKKNDTFFFKGPQKFAQSASKRIAEYYLGAPRLINGRYSELYMIDMRTGTVRSITGY